ncbi:MAG: hypothetical protein ACTSPI_13345, partial [Candidatus Heimdallarchaeaceae archaeon]
TKRKEVTLILIVLISISLAFYFNPISSVRGETVPAPKLKEYTPAGYSIDNGTIITVNYTVPRFAGIDGVLLVGEGSNLTTNLDSALELNYTHSYRDLSYYSGSFNLTENTKFKAYAWSGDVSNGTYEDLEVVNHLGAWHYIYARNSLHPPYLDESKVNIDKISSYTFVAEDNQTVVLKYIVRNGDPADKVTLALSVYRDKITNGSLTNYEGISFLEMDYETNDTGTGFPVYTISFNFTERTIYFAANNSAGWDIDPDSGELRIYKIQNGFTFESEKEMDDYYTDVDPVNVIVRTVNETEHDVFGVSYKVEESASNDTEIVTWTDLTNGVLFNETIVTNDNGWNNTVKEYRFTLGTFDIGNVIYFEAFNLYYGERYNETDGFYHKLKIYDSRPQLSLLPRNNSYLNDPSVEFNFTIELIRGSISGIIVDFGDGEIKNITDFETTSITHNYTDVSAEYQVTLYVNSTLFTTNNVTHTIFIDITPPVGTLDPRTTNTTIEKSTDGYVELYFTYEDNFGIDHVWIDWGDGTVWNATGEYNATHIYLHSGDYDVVIEIVDYAGNSFNITLSFSVELTEETTATTPYTLLFPVFSFAIMVYVYSKIKNRSIIN